MNTHPQTTPFTQREQKLRTEHERLLARDNQVDGTWTNGVFERFCHPVVTADHVPLEWRYDFDPVKNPFLMERLGVNAALNPGAFRHQGRICMLVRVEGSDRKSFFAIAESPSGIDRFRFWPEPVQIPAREGETNIYDMRITAHADGWVYGVFCSESRDPKAASADFSSAVAQAGIVRTKDFKDWERLPNLRTPATQQRNAVLHPEWIQGKYAFYTRPMDGFIDIGSGGGIGWTLCDDIATGVTGPEKIMDPRGYHTIKEAKNGLGPPPIKAREGWVHLAHGVRACASGLRYVLYLFMTALEDPSRVIARPGGYFLAPYGGEGMGDVSNVVFSNGWVELDDDQRTVLIYYGGSDTRCYVARTTVPKLVDWCKNTPPDAWNSAGSLHQRLELIRSNARLRSQR